MPGHDCNDQDAFMKSVAASLGVAADGVLVFTCPHCTNLHEFEVMPPEMQLAVILLYTGD
jgi:hypothetical protein